MTAASDKRGKMGEASEMSSVSEVSTADAGKAGGGAGVGGKAKILVPVVVLLVVLSVIGAVIISGKDDSAKKGSDSGEDDPSNTPSGGGGGGGGGDGGDPPADDKTKKPAFQGPNKVLFCFIGDLKPGIFPDDNTCTHLILIADVSSEGIVLISGYEDFKKNMTIVLSKYKKTEGGLSVSMSRLVLLKTSVTLKYGSLKTYYDSKLMHYGMHRFITEFKEDDFKRECVPYLKSIHENHKKLDAERMGKEAPDPLYGFMGFQLRPYKAAKDVANVAQKIEDILGFGVLFIIHVNLELPNNDTECVYGGTPLNLAEVCKKPSFKDYVTMQDYLAFKQGSKVAAMFDLAVVRTEVAAVQKDQLLSKIKKDVATKSSLETISTACAAGGTVLTTEPQGASVIASIKDNFVYAYDDITTFSSKLANMWTKKFEHHLGFGVIRIGYDTADCAGGTPYKRLRKFQEDSRIKRE